MLLFGVTVKTMLQICCQAKSQNLRSGLQSNLQLRVSYTTAPVSDNATASGADNMSYSDEDVSDSCPTPGSHEISGARLKV